jgi:hypothetical protein
MKWITIVFASLLLFITTSWFFGIVLTDRWVWSQWIAWIPTQVVMLLLVISLIVVVITKAKKLVIILALVLSSVTYWFTFEENKFFSKATAGSGLRIVGWTMSHSKKRVSKESAEKVISLKGDITLLTHGWYVRGESSIREWIGVENRPVSNGPFTILTTLQVVEVQTLIASDGIYISMFIIDTSETLGKPLVLWAIDLPSDLDISRIKTATKVQRLLATLNTPTPDVVIGDFNMTRGSYSIEKMFPELSDASDEGGFGLLASFPMEYPLYHIDHTLIREGLYCSAFSFINPQIGRHRVQIVELRTDKEKQ